MRIFCTVESFPRTVHESLHLKSLYASPPAEENHKTRLGPDIGTEGKPTGKAACLSFLGCTSNDLQVQQCRLLQLFRYQHFFG